MIVLLWLFPVVPFVACLLATRLLYLIHRDKYESFEARPKYAREMLIAGMMFAVILTAAACWAVASMYDSITYGSGNFSSMTVALIVMFVSVPLPAAASRDVVVRYFKTRQATNTRYVFPWGLE